MDKTYLDALKQRKTELLRELNHIDGILKFYPDEYSQPKSENIEKVKVRTDVRNMTVKDRVIAIIKNLGGSAYVSDVANELKKLYPDRDDKSINNQVRNYLHILKKEDKLKPEMKGHNKYLYHVIEK